MPKRSVKVSEPEMVIVEENSRAAEGHKRISLTCVEFVWHNDAVVLVIVGCSG